MNVRRMAYEASLLTSATTLRSAMARPAAELPSRFQGLRDGRVIKPGMSVRRAITAVDRWMRAHYRTEVIYKNALANQILMERHGLSSASMISEFKVADSILDCVIVNGEATAYEIKTELDNPRKLMKQLEDYRRAFQHVYLVTHVSLADEYSQVVAGSAVGLILLGEDGLLECPRPSTSDSSGLDIRTMMKSLRKPEYTRIAETIHGDRLHPPATEHFRRCLEIAESVPTADYRLAFEATLRQRKPREPQSVARAQFAHVRHNLLKIDPTRRQLANLSEWMTRRL